MTRTPEVFGKTVDEHTRCVHYATELDIIAIRFACCDRYYPVPPLPLRDRRPSRAAVAAGQVRPARHPVRELSDRTDNRDVQIRQRLPRMRGRLQPSLRGAFGLLFRFLRSHRPPLRTAGKM
jgi:hypothetical protein